MKKNKFNFIILILILSTKVSYCQSKVSINEILLGGISIFEDTSLNINSYFIANKFIPYKMRDIYNKNDSLRLVKLLSNYIENKIVTDSIINVLYKDEEVSLNRIKLKPKVETFKLINLRMQKKKLKKNENIEHLNFNSSNHRLFYFSNPIFFDKYVLIKLTYQVHFHHGVACIGIFEINNGKIILKERFICKS